MNEEMITVQIPIGSIVYTPEQQKDYRKRRQKEEQRREWYKDCPKYYFASIDSEYSDIHPKTAARLFYLAAFMSYKDGVLELTQKTPMKYSDLQGVLGLGRSAVWKFWKEAGNKYVFSDRDGILYMPHEFFHRGKFQTDTLYQQVFSDSVKTLYRQMPESRRQYLGYVFRLIPYINLEYNMLCHNPMEKDMDKINRLTVDEFCAAVGYTPTKRSRLLRLYRDNITFPVNGKPERFCSFVSDGVDLDTARIFINPHILYRGTVPREVWILGEFCKCEG